MCVDRVNDHGEEDLASEKPDDDEQTKEDVASLCETQVFEQFSSLATRVSGLSSPHQHKGQGKTHREHYVDQIHSTQNYDANAGVIVPIREEEQRYGKDVVCEHLGVVLSLLLDVDNQNLGDPKSPLGEVVEFRKTGDVAEGPTFPHAMQIKEVVRVPDDVHAE